MSVTALVEERVAIPEGVRVEVQEGVVAVAQGETELRRPVVHPAVEIAVEGDEVVVKSLRMRKQERALVGTYASHIRNMVQGVTEGFTYTMKIVYAHFPVKVGVRGDRVVIENFLGERHPRTARIMGDTKVEVRGDTLTLTGPDVEAVGQTAANVEQATKIKNKDPRVFQDGIYIVSKGEA